MTTVLVPVNAHALPHRSPAELLALAKSGLAEQLEHPPARYAAAHLAALRAAAAVLAARARPASVGRRRLTSVWALLAIVAPELGEWAAYFASGSARRAADQRVTSAVITDVEADALTHEASRFLTVVEEVLGQ